MIIDNYNLNTKYDSNAPNIQKLCYELYKNDWLQRISTNRKNDSLKNYYDLTREAEQNDPDDNSKPADIDYITYLEDYGFDGELYVCFNEFIDNEYQDQDYMRSLLNDAEYNDYLADITSV